MGVAGRSPRCSSSTMCTDIAFSSRLELAPQAPCARPLLISDGLLGRVQSVEPSLHLLHYRGLKVRYERKWSDHDKTLQTILHPGSSKNIVAGSASHQMFSEES